MSDYSNISAITYVYYGIAVPSQSTQNRVILFYFCAWHTPGFRGCAPGVRQAWRRWLSAPQLHVLKLACEGQAKSLILFCNILAMKSAPPHSLVTADTSAPPRTSATCNPSDSPLHLRDSRDDGRQRRIIRRQWHRPISLSLGGGGLLRGTAGVFAGRGGTRELIVT